MILTDTDSTATSFLNAEPVMLEGEMYPALVTIWDNPVDEAAYGSVPLLELGTRDGLATVVGALIGFVFLWLMLIGYMRRR